MKNKLSMLFAMLGICAALTACTSQEFNKNSQATTHTEESSTEYTKVTSREDTYLYQNASSFWNMSNLKSLHLPEPALGNYVNAHFFCNMLLLYGCDADTLADPLAETYDIFFQLLDPVSGEIIKELSLNESVFIQYSISGDRLFLMDSENHFLAIYNQNLELVSRLDVTQLHIGSINYPQAIIGENEFLTINDMHEFVKITYQKDSYNQEILPVSHYDLTLHEISEDGTYALLSGIDCKTYLYEAFIYDLQSDIIIQRCPTDQYTSCTMGNNSEILCGIGNNNIYSYTSKEEQSYFYSADYVNASITSNGNFYFTRSTYLDDNMNFEGYYGNTKDCISHFQLPSWDKKTDTYYNYSSSLAYFPQWNYGIVLAFENYTTPFLILWDMNLTADSYTLKTSSNIQEVLSNAFENTGEENHLFVIANPDSYHWGELDKCYQYAKVLEDKYGFHLHFGEDVPGKIAEYSIDTSTSAEYIMNALTNLELALSHYPASFFSQIPYSTYREFHLYIATRIYNGGEYSLSEAGGFVSHEDGVIKLAVVGDYIENDTIHHELSHVIDSRLDFIAGIRPDFIYSEEIWNSYNPEGFEYLSDYTNYIGNDAYYNHPDYFIYEYSTTYPTEDRATIFGEAMYDYVMGYDWVKDSYFQKDSPVYKKLQYYCNCIRAGFDTSDWPEELPWEYFL